MKKGVKFYRKAVFAIVGPSGTFKKLCSSRRVALSQFSLHFAKETRPALSPKHLKEVSEEMRQRRWRIEPAWLIVSPRAALKARET